MVNRVCWLVLWFGVAVVGCQKEPSSPTILAQRPQSFVSDVPVPKGFEQDLRKSEHTVVEGKRKVVHYYMGDEKLRAVRDFYVNYMPQAEWVNLNERLEAGVYLLNYRKNEETCEIRIESLPGGLFGGGTTQVRATIKPMYVDSPN